MRLIILVFIGSILGIMKAEAQNRGSLPLRIACEESFQYSYQVTDCIKTGANPGVVRACAAGFKYDYQKFDCMEEAVGDGRAVGACILGFNYDYQRFDCLKLATNGRLTEYCLTKYKYDYEKFNCLKEM